MVQLIHPLTNTISYGPLTHPLLPFKTVYNTEKNMYIPHLTPIMIASPHIKTKLHVPSELAPHLINILQSKMKDHKSKKDSYVNIFGEQMPMTQTELLMYLYLMYNSIRKYPHFYGYHPLNNGLVRTIRTIKMPIMNQRALYGL